MAGTAAATSLISTAAKSHSSSPSASQTQCPNRCWIGGDAELAGEQNFDVDAALRKRVELYLDQGFGECHLKDPRVAELVQNAMLFFDGERYRLTAWVVMPNHAHTLLTPCAGYELSRVMHSLKSYTANEANKLLNRSGQFWQPESFDRWIRNADHFAKGDQLY